jgi:flagellar biosynthesis/type III secretory pathway chaperone
MRVMSRRIVPCKLLLLQTKLLSSAHASACQVPTLLKRKTIPATQLRTTGANAMHHFLCAGLTPESMFALAAMQRNIRSSVELCQYSDLYPCSASL